MKYIYTVTVIDEYEHDSERRGEAESFEEMMMDLADIRLNFGWGQYIADIEAWEEEVVTGGLRRRLEAKISIASVSEYKEKAIERRRKRKENSEREREEAMRRLSLIHI